MTVRQLRQQHTNNFATCASGFISELLDKVPISDIARDHFMEALARIRARGPDARLGDEVDDVLIAIGACQLMLHVTANGDAEEVHTLTDALRFSADFALSCQPPDADAA